MRGDVPRNGDEWQRHELRVVVLGAAGRCEERLARQTDYWGEISSATGLQVQLVLVGPEISEDAPMEG